jgi:hypothetical protein
VLPDWWHDRALKRINRFTVGDIVIRTGCDQVHASLRTQREDRSVNVRSQVSFGGAVKLPEDRYSSTSPEAVAELRALLRGSVLRGSGDA